MSNLKGGYQIIDLKNTAISGASVAIDSTLRGKILNSGKPCLLINANLNGVLTTPIYTNFTIVSDSNIAYSDAIYIQSYGLRRIAIDTTGKFRLISATELPTVSGTDNGKALVVSGGSWSAQAIATLPAVTASDNGKVLMVKNGAWSVESLPE